MNGFLISWLTAGHGTGFADAEPRKSIEYRFQGRDFRLTDVHGNVVDAILS